MSNLQTYNLRGIYSVHLWEGQSLLQFSPPADKPPLVTLFTQS